MANYQVFAKHDSDKRRAGLFNENVPHGAHYYGEVQRGAGADDRPCFKAYTAPTRFHGPHQLFMTTEQSTVPVCYVTIEINHFAHLASRVPIAIVATALGLSGAAVSSTNPVIAFVPWINTAPAWQKNWVATDLLPAISEYAKSHAATALLLDNVRKSGAYVRYFGATNVKTDSEAGPTWTGMRL
jgi:GNAT superfamily N-acetyltransferase